MARPQPDEYTTRAEYRWALKQWKRQHGGSLVTLLFIAVICGALTGSALVMLALMAFAVVVYLIARSRP